MNNRYEEIQDQIHELSKVAQKLSNPVALTENSNIYHHMLTWEELKEAGAAYDKIVKLEEELSELSRPQ